MLDRTVNHQKLLKEVLVFLSSQGFFVWSNSTGAIKSDGRYQRYGLIGSSDILGITPDGVFLALEIKTGKAVQNKQQKKFEERVKKNNGIYKVVRSLKDLGELLNDERKSIKTRNDKRTGTGNVSNGRESTKADIRSSVSSSGTETVYDVVDPIGEIS